MSCSGNRLLLLCHPDCILTMAPVSMALHVSYMRSLCKKEWRTGRQMILSALRHRVAEKFIQFCAGICVNKPEAAVSSGESTFAIMQADSRKLVHTGLTKPSRLSIADEGALQLCKLRRSIVRVILWCGWTTGCMPSFGPIQ